VPLATKIVLSVGFPVALLVWTTSASLDALDRAGEASRRSLARIGPAVRQADDATETLEALARLHVRSSIMDDAGYVRAWEARARGLVDRLEAFRTTLETAWERKQGTKAARAIDRYRAISAIETDGTTELRVLSIAERRRASRVGARANRALDGLVRSLTATAARADQAAATVAQRAWDATVAVACLAGLLALVASAWIAWRITRGLRRLIDATLALERGRLDQPVAIAGRDELARLALAFESLATNLQERDRVSEQTLRLVGHDLAEPLMTIRDAIQRLALDGSARLEARQRRLLTLIGEAAENLLRRTARMGEDAPPALEHARVPSLEPPVPQLLSLLDHQDER
jgi:signal transduction histidine kinase